MSESTHKVEDVIETVAPAIDGQQVHSGGGMVKRSEGLEETVAPAIDGQQVHAGGGMA
jgi:hypothetical protein